ncbi:MAG: GGDEF domain-containing protein [Gordonibacter sp.]
MPAREDIEPRPSRKSNIKTALVCGAGLFVIVIVLVVYVNIISRETESSLNLFMEEVADVESANARAIFEGEFNILHGASAFITQENIGNEAALLERLREVVDSGSFSRVGVVDLEGRGVAYDQSLGSLTSRDYIDQDFVRKSKGGADYVSAPYEDELTGVQSLAFSVPVYDIKHEGGDPIGVLVGVTSAESFANIIDVSLFAGRGSVSIIDSSGNVLLRSAAAEVDGVDVFSAGYDKAGLPDEAKESLAKGESGSATVIRPNGTTLFTIYRPIGINDWFIDVVVPSDYLEAQNHTVLVASMVMALFVVGVVSLLMYLILRVRHRSEGALARAALTDRLTGIDNELAFMRKSAVRPEYYEGGCSLVLFNLVGFSLFNTIYGFDAGSACLRNIAHLLKSDLRRHELVAHLTGDRFAMLVETSDARRADARLVELMNRIEAATRADDSQYRIVSQCCVYRLERADFERDINLILQDMAVPLKRAQSHAGSRIVRYDECDVAAATRARQIESIMSTALSEKEFLAFFQPQYDISGDVPVLCGAEALARWNSPILGLVTPDEFIPVFERNGSISQIDHYILEHACVRLRQWLDDGLRCVPLSVNLSRRNLFSADLIEQIEHVVDKHRVPHELIKLELAEGIVAENERQLISTAEKLRARGFKIVMDDFGTGYSSFPALKDIPFDTIKLDRSFFGESIADKRGRATLMSVIALLEQLGFKILAEGVETAREVFQLKEWGCQTIQGYVFGRPVEGTVFEQECLRPAQNDLISAQLDGRSF